MKTVNCSLFEHPVEITHAIVTIASQENCDGPEYDLMMDAVQYIRELESRIEIIVKYHPTAHPAPGTATEPEPCLKSSCGT